MRLLRSFHNLPIRYKLLLSHSAVYILAIILGSTIIYSLVHKMIEDNIESVLQNSTSATLAMVKTSVEVSIKNHLRAVAEKNREIVTHFYGMYKDGYLTEKEAKRQAEAVLLSQKIGETGYIYCIDSNGFTIVHPKKELINQNFSGDFEFVKQQMERKEGYIEYDWKNPGESGYRPKALYMAYFAPWDWIISVSSYRSEFRTLVNVEDFRDSILAQRFGETGYSFVVDGKGNVVLHPKLGEMNYFDAKDTHVRQLINEICERKNGKIVYSWINPGETVARSKLAIINYIPDLDWIVASSSYLDEFHAPLRTVRDLFAAMAIVSLLLVLPLTMRISSAITNPLQDLMNRFAADTPGDFSARVDSQSGDELGQLASYFNMFMEKLEQYNEKLQGEIRERMELEREVMEIGDRERQRIGQDLHDDLCSHLVGIEVLGEVLNRKLEEECSGQAPCAGRIRSLTSEAIEKTRRLARGLCPVHLVGYGLESALRELCIKVSELFNISCELRCKESVRIHDNTVATHLFYIAQEAVQNTTKHGEAKQVTIELSSDEETISLRITDNGVGIPDELPAAGMGLRIMSHRAQMIGASFELKRNPEGGTIVECLVRAQARKEPVYGQD